MRQAERENHEKDSQSVPNRLVTSCVASRRKTSQGKTVAEACRALSISEWTCYRWRKFYGGMDKVEAKQLKELEKENARLKKLLAEKELELDILKEALKAKF